MSQPLRMLHIAAREASDRIWTPLFCRTLQGLGQLHIITAGAEMPLAEHMARIRQADVLLTGWGSSPVPDDLAQDRGRLRYICNITGSVRHWISLRIIDAGIPVTNWGTAPADRLAEGAMTLLMATVKDLHQRIVNVRGGGWRLDDHHFGGSLRGLNVGIYGYGAIGQRFVPLLRPFGAVMRIYDPYAASIPEDCTRAESLETLFERSEAIVIHAGLTEETRGSVTADLLARLPDHGIVINTARGGIIDQDALFAELEAGRLRAGLDVLEPDRLSPDHAARSWPNLILTAHQIGRNRPDYGQERTWLDDFHQVCLDNLSRFVSGEPLRFRMDHDRYVRST